MTTTTLEKPSVDPSRILGPEFDGTRALRVHKQPERGETGLELRARITGHSHLPLEVYARYYNAKAEMDEAIKRKRELFFDATDLTKQEARNTPEIVELAERLQADVDAILADHQG